MTLTAGARVHAHSLSGMGGHGTVTGWEKPLDGSRPRLVFVRLDSGAVRSFMPGALTTGAAMPTPEAAERLRRAQLNELFRRVTAAQATARDAERAYAEAAGSGSVAREREAFAELRRARTACEHLERLHDHATHGPERTPPDA